MFLYKCVCAFVWDMYVYFLVVDFVLGLVVCLYVVLVVGMVIFVNVVFVNVL